MELWEVYLRDHCTSSQLRLEAMPTYPYYIGTDGYKDRKTSVLEKDSESYPNEPLNTNIQWAFNSQTTAADLYWDDPGLLVTNRNFKILGVNIYRSNNSELGPYFKINPIPLGGGFYRDETLNQTVTEDVTANFISRGDQSQDARWIFKVENYPIVKTGSEAVPADVPEDVEVYIDGVLVRVARVYGQTGEIELQGGTSYDVSTNRPIPPILPKQDSVVTCKYAYNLNLYTSVLGQRIFYKVVTVGQDTSRVSQETPLFTVEPSISSKWKTWIISGVRPSTVTSGSCSKGVNVLRCSFARR